MIGTTQATIPGPYVENTGFTGDQSGRQQGGKSEDMLGPDADRLPILNHVDQAIGVDREVDQLVEVGFGRGGGKEGTILLGKFMIHVDGLHDRMSADKGQP